MKEKIPFFAFLCCLIASIFTSCETNNQIVNVAIISKGGDTIVVNGDTVIRDTLILPPGTKPDTVGSSNSEYYFSISLELISLDVPGALLMDSSTVSAQYYSTTADIVRSFVRCQRIGTKFPIPKSYILVECFSVLDPTNIIKWTYVNNPDPEFKIYKNDFKHGVGETLCYMVSAVDTVGRLLSTKRVIYITRK